MGRLVSDPELKTTPAGVSVTSFRIAVERNYTDKDGNRQADFFDVVAWRGTAEFICRYFGKGSLILVEGQLQSRTYQTKDGNNRSVVEIVADKAQDKRINNARNNHKINQEHNYHWSKNTWLNNSAEIHSPVANNCNTKNSHDFREKVCDIIEKI